ncbi:O-antigen ligase family protein [Xylanibacter ruminicola]|uniref:O-antigen ligase family protein n=1 Tax=Xylanibacter ruminicola TaxID=839 RepID=UPI0018AFDF03|nr:O-antigen ligase family protein [Xylanibacter ruminicola]
MKDITLPIPMSLPNEMLEILLLAIAIFDIRQTAKIEKILNPMLLALIIWCSFCTLEILNDTCNLGINFGAWYQGARLMAFQLLYTFLVFTIYISSPKILMRYIKLWAFLSLFSAFWVWKQQNMGFTPAENAWIQTRGRLTHILNAGTLIRYFSTFSDAANYGCNAAATTVAFILFGMTTRIRKDKLLFLITGILVFWGMFASGTRTAIFCVAAGFALYIFISKSFKIAIPFTIVFGIFAFILAFTTIGNGNQQIRRMRSAFNKDDASANVREVNKEVIRKYIQDAPWGIGLGMGWDNVPANSKYFKLATIPPDSEYVFIWIRTGPIGMTMFIICTAIMIAAACSTILFRLKNASLRGIGAGFTCAFLSIQLGGYANQVIMQFPNCLIFYGGLSIVFILPELEPAWTEYEQQRIAIQEEKKRLKLEKKLAKRV